jgi:hypothetical protein
VTRWNWGCAVPFKGKFRQAYAQSRYEFNTTA